MTSRNSGRVGFTTIATAAPIAWLFAEAQLAHAATSCSNGILEAGEQCDHGNGVMGFGGGQSEIHVAAVRRSTRS